MKSRLLLGALVVVLAGCGSGNGSNGDAGTDAGSDVETDAIVCNGSIVPARVSSNMTLTKACSPWHVQAPGTFVSAPSGNPVLTIEAGVTLEFDTDAYLSIGVDNPGGIVAVGASAAPIIFTSSAAVPTAGSWASVSLGSQTLATSQLAFAQFMYGGAMNNDGYSYTATDASLMMFGDKPLSVSIHDVTLSHNSASGVALDGTQVTYGAGSGNLTVSDWGNGAYAFVISADAASSIPTTLTAPSGNVELICGNDCQPGTGGMALVDRTQTWPVIPLPYVVWGQTGNGLQIEGTGTSAVALTIDAPNVLEFGATGSILVDPNGSGLGSLVAVGTASNRIVFTSSATAPSTAAWQGIKFVVSPAGQGGSQLVDCDVKYGGGFFKLASTTGACSLAEGPVYVGLSETPAVGPAITACSIQNYPSADYGIIVDHGVTNASSYAANNTFAAQTVCAQ